MSIIRPKRWSTGWSGWGGGYSYPWSGLGSGWSTGSYRPLGWMEQFGALDTTAPGVDGAVDGVADGVVDGAQDIAAHGVDGVVDGAADMLAHGAVAGDRTHTDDQL
ncbi:myoactive tetradecapeptide family protein [Ostertagia ostertagi]